MVKNTSGKLTLLFNFDVTLAWFAPDRNLQPHGANYIRHIHIHWFLYMQERCHFLRLDCRQSVVGRSIFSWPGRLIGLGSYAVQNRPIKRTDP